VFWFSLCTSSLLGAHYPESTTSRLHILDRLFLDDTKFSEDFRTVRVTFLVCDYSRWGPLSCVQTSPAKELGDVCAQARGRKRGEEPEARFSKAPKSHW